MYIKPEIHEFFIEGNDLKKSHVLLHITEPSSPSEIRKGYFFALTEINGGSIEQIEHLQQMIDDLESGYYETEDEDGKNAFELSLEYINRRGHHILEYKNSDIHCLVGVLRDNFISLSYHGSPRALLFFNSKQGLKKIDILNEDKEDLEDGQLFSSVLEGQLNPNDFFYLITPQVDDYFAHERIQKILTSRTTRQSAVHLQRVLKDIRNDISFGGIIIKAGEKQEEEKIPNTMIDRDGGSNASVNKMVESREKTQETLTNPVMGKIKRKAKNIMDQKQNPKTGNGDRKVYFSNTMETNYRPRELQIEKQSVLNNILIGFGRALVILIINLYKSLLFLLKFIGKTFLAVLLIISNKGGRRREIIGELKRDINNRKKFIKNLPLTSKIIFVVTLIFLAIFISSISYLRVKENQQIKEQEYSSLIEEIKEKKDLSEASMVYNDDERAFQLLKEAEALLATLPTDTEEKKLRSDELNIEIESALVKLRKIVEVQPELVADLSSLGANIDKIEPIDDTIIAYGNDDKTLYRIDLDTNKIEQKEHSSIPRLLAASTPKENDKIIFLVDDNQIAEYDKETMTVSEKEISFPEEDTKIKDVFVYNRRLYTLSNNKNQIYKHGPTVGGYDRGSEWITENSIDLNLAISFAIDGDLYVLKSNGEIIRFTGGQKDNFSIINIDPPLENPTKIWTYNGVGSIYILEPAQKRVVVINKQGKLVRQYTSSIWQNPTGMVVDTSNNEIFVLDNNKLYKFEI